MPSITVENYLKKLYSLQQRDAADDLVLMGRLAAAMGVTPGTATTMVKTLDESGLVRYEPRGGVRLSPAGEKLALHVLRRHRLIELFLVQVLGFDWSEVHDEAEELEHAISDKLLQRIDAMLGHPTADPHGDPIPPRRGRMPKASLTPLAHCNAGQRVAIARISDEDPRFLQFADRHGLRPGSSLRVASRDDIADALTLHPDGCEPITLGRNAATRILVQTLAPKAAAT
jgi:DtxR family Mn-dependent transcriptional regulator